MIPLQIERLGPAYPAHVVREPYHRRRRKKLGGVEDACHLLCVVGEGERWEVRWGVGVGAGGAFGCCEVV